MLCVPLRELYLIWMPKFLITCGLRSRTSFTVRISPVDFLAFENWCMKYQ